MKFKAKALLGLLVGCMAVMPKMSVYASDIFNDAIFSSPVEIEMLVKTSLNISDPENARVSEAIVKVMYLSEDNWISEYTDIFTNQESKVTEKKSWDGSVMKKFISSQGNINSIPSMIVSEEKDRAYGDINPLLSVYGSLGKNYIVSNPEEGKYHVVNAEHACSKFDAVIHKNDELTSKIEYSLKEKDFLSKLYSEYNITYKNVKFPSKIMYTYYGAELQIEYEIINISDIPIEDYSKYTIEFPKQHAQIHISK